MIKIDYYQQFINSSIKELPLDALEEIADFISFIQQKFKKTSLTQQNENALLLAELHLLSYQQQQHLEQEFADYEQQFPKE
jgi:hypothetical protein